MVTSGPECYLCAESCNRQLHAWCKKSDFNHANLEHCLFLLGPTSGEEGTLASEYKKELTSSLLIQLKYFPAQTKYAFTQVL